MEWETEQWINPWDRGKPEEGECWVKKKEAETKIADLKEQVESCQTLNSIFTLLSIKNTELKGCKVKLKRVKELLNDLHETIYEKEGEVK